jgi:hypothetical protein
MASRLRRTLTHPLGGTLIACILTAAMTPLAWAHRVTGPLSVVPIAGLGVLGVAMLVTLYRLADVIARRSSRAALHHAAQIGLLVVINLVFIAGLVVAIDAILPTVWPLADSAPFFAYIIASAVRAATFIGVGGAAVALVFTVFIGASAITHRLALLDAMGRFFAYVVLALTLVYALSVPVLMVNASHIPVVVPTIADVVAVRHIDLPSGVRRATWIEVASPQRPGSVERIPLREGIDDARVWRLRRGRRVEIDTGTGLLGLQWIVRLGIHQDHDLEALVAATPTAEWPRKWLMGYLARQARWAELVEQTREYSRHYPADRDTITKVAFSLRAGGQVEAARALEAELGAQPQGGRAGS